MGDAAHLWLRDLKHCECRVHIEDAHADVLKILRRTGNGIRSASKDFGEVTASSS